LGKSETFGKAQEPRPNMGKLEKFHANLDKIGKGAFKFV